MKIIDFLVGKVIVLKKQEQKEIPIQTYEKWVSKLKYARKPKDREKFPLNDLWESYKETIK